MMKDLEHEVDKTGKWVEKEADQVYHDLIDGVEDNAVKRYKLRNKKVGMGKKNGKSKTPVIMLI